MRKQLKRTLVASTVFVGAVVTTSLPAAAKAGTGCSPGNGVPGAVTLEEGLALPRIVAGLEAGAYTVEELTTSFTAFDANADDLVCLKAISNLRGESSKRWGFLYLIGDNTHPQ